jgi:hypothetical protein
MRAVDKLILPFSISFATTVDLDGAVPRPSQLPVTRFMTSNNEMFVVALGDDAEQPLPPPVEMFARRQPQPGPLRSRPLGNADASPIAPPEFSAPMPGISHSGGTLHRAWRHKLGVKSLNSVVEMDV